MTIRFSRRGLHGQVVNLLGERIIKGELAPGERIDLDGLLEELKISRTVLRESIKVLTEKGLLEARPRYGTYVTERKEWRLLDEDVMSWRSAGEPDALLVHELGEVRQIFEPSAARLAAVRRTERQLYAMAVALTSMQASVAAGKAGEIADADAAFHRAILGASGNELLERFEVMLEPALHARNRLMVHQNSGHVFLEHHGNVYRAIADGDGDAAFTAMATLTSAAMVDAENIIRGANAS